MDNQGVRLKMIIDSLSLSINEFSKCLGYTRSEKIYRIISNKNNISYKILNDILKVFPQVNGEYLMLGKGEMFTSQLSPGDRIRAISHEYNLNPYELTKIVGSKYAGEIYDVVVKNYQPSEVLLEKFGEKFANVKKWVLTGEGDPMVKPIEKPFKETPFQVTADEIRFIRGKAMEPDFPEGYQVTIKKVDHTKFIEWGKAYVIDTINGSMIRKVMPGDDLKLISNNPIDFPDIEIKLSDVEKLYLIIAVFKIYE